MGAHAVLETSVGYQERGGERDKQKEWKRDRETASPGEKAATATDASSDLEKRGREGDGAQEAAGTDDDSSRHAKGWGLISGGSRHTLEEFKSHTDITTA